MKKFFCKTFLIFSFLISALTFASCQVEWFGDIEQDLDEKLTTIVRFYKENPLTASDPDSVPYYEKRFLIGSKITQENFPQNGSNELYKILPGWKITGPWQNDQVLSPEFISFDSGKTVKEIIVPSSNEISDGILKLYIGPAGWEPRTDIHYVLNYSLQNLYDNGYTNKPVPLDDGRADSSIVLSSINDYQNRLYTQGGLYNQAANHSNVYTIYGDGSLVINITLNRQTAGIHFRLNSSDPSESWESYPDIINDYELNQHNEYSADRYYMTRRCGFEFDKMDINLVIPKKQGYSFYGWQLNSEKICADNEDPYDYIENLEGKILLQTYNYYPVWGPIPYKVYIQGPEGIEFNGSLGSEIPIYDDEPGKKYIKISSVTKLPVPEFPSGYDSADFEFVGYRFSPDSADPPFDYTFDTTNNWYTPGGNTVSEGGTLTAVWKYKNLYLDPVIGLDTNDGLSSSTAVNTLYHAKSILNNYHSDTGTNILLMNKITSQSDLINLSNLNTYNAILKRAPGTTGTLIEISSSSTINLTNTTIDGGNIQARDAFIKNNGTLTLGGGVIIRNIESVATDGKGAVINNTGTLNIGSSATSVVDFSNITTKIGGAIYNHNPESGGSDANLIINSRVFSLDVVSTGSSTSLEQKAVVAYIESGNLILNANFDLDQIISINKGAKIILGADVTGNVTLALDYSSYTSGEKQILFDDGSEPHVAASYSNFTLSGSTYDPATLTAGWTINSTGYLVYNVFTGGSIVLPTDFKAKVGISFVDPNSMSYYSESQSTSVKTTSITNKIFIGIKIWYLNDTLDSNLVVDASGSGLTSISNANFANLEVKLLYNGVDTGAHLSGGGFVLGNTTWPAGEYVIKVSFSYAGLPYSYSIPFTATNP